MSIVTTFLGAHALPPESDGDRTPTSTQVCEHDAAGRGAGGPRRRGRRLLRMHRASRPSRRARVFEAARALGLPVKLHAEQLTTWAAPRWPPRSAPCRPTISNMPTRRASQAMAQAGTVAVLLPGAFYFLRETQKPPVDLLRKHGVPIAIATDSNPGTSPLTSLLLTMNMAATFFRLTVDECLPA